MGRLLPIVHRAIATHLIRKAGFTRRSACAGAVTHRRDLQQRVAKFGLSLHPEKTRLIRFGRYAG